MESSQGSTNILHQFCAALRRAEIWTYPAEELAGQIPPV
jgi:hypothetical protein